MKDTTKLLPIGSVVLLDGGQKKVMITGFYTIPSNDTNTMYDYSGCLYPEGVISSNQTLLFNHNQIVKVYYMGYKDNEEKEFKAKLGEVINNQDNATSEEVNNQPKEEVPTEEGPQDLNNAA